MKMYRRLQYGGYGDGPGDPLTSLIGSSPWLSAPGNKPMKSLRRVRSNNTPVPLLVTEDVPGKYMPVRQTVSGTPTINTPVNPMPGNTAPAGIRKPGFLSTLFSAQNMTRLSKGMENVTPFISNIYNAFQKAPRPNVPILDTFTNLNKIDLSNERYQVRRTTDAANKATERNLDSNTAEAVKAFNRGQEFDRISSINERENNANIGILNQQAMMDMNVKGVNTERRNDYQTAKTAADIADVRERSANIANAGEKLTLIGNEKRKAAVERDKVRVLSSLFSKSGVLKRQAREWKKMGIEDPLGQNYDYAESDDEFDARTKSKKAYGGMLRSIPSKRLN